MVDIFWKNLFIVCLISCINFSCAFENKKCGKESCIANCKSNLVLESACQRGCLFFDLLRLAQGEQAKTLPAQCLQSCKDAYSFLKPSLDACKNGCVIYKKEQSQCVDKVAAKSDEVSTSQPAKLLAPFMVIHRVYKNMADHLQRRVSMTFNFYHPDNSDKLIVISRGVVLPNEIMKPGDSELSPQLSFTHEKSGAGPTHGHHRHGVGSWWKCALERSIEPLLVLMIALSVVALLWLCCLSPATAPTHTISQRSDKDPFMEKKAYISLPVAILNAAEKSPIPVLANEEAGPIPEKMAI